MPAFSPTTEQNDAIHALGGSVLVSAAAGSGKTAVLAERCAYLVCDAPPAQRCEVDQLLVLTFTEAAAAEMRGRIIDRIRDRLQANPADGRLREQLALAGAAHISTIHSFCLWLIRRWFTEANVDPAAAVMDAEEAVLLRREVLGRILNRLYAYAVVPGDPLGASSLGKASDKPESWDLGQWELGARPEPAMAEAFLRLVDVYGLGNDFEIVNFVLRLYDFTTSIPNWPDWLTQAARVPGGRPEEVVERLYQELRLELGNQVEHVAAGLASVGEGYTAGVLREYADQLQTWLGLFGGAKTLTRISALEKVRQLICSYDLPKRSSSKKKAGDPEREQESAILKTIKRANERLRNRFALFSVDEWTAGLRRTAPFVATICDIVAALHQAYAAEKRRLAVIDFADLERLAYELLAEPDGSGLQPSAIARVLHGKFVYVLVDEFQDINPLQEAILRLASREAAVGAADNLFAVGDIKQSIYRFRLAEPSIFAERLNRFRVSADGAAAAPAKGAGRPLFLQKNFRSRPELLDAVNLVFGTLMNGAGGVAYDEQAVLRQGRVLEDAPPREPIELHILEQTISTSTSKNGDADEAEEENGDLSADDSAEPRIADYANPANWTPIEREACLIGQRIRELTSAPSKSGNSRLENDIGASPQAAGQSNSPQEAAPGTGRPWQYRDIVILLRATKVNAERMAAMLSAMGIPAHAEVGGSLFAAREVRDVIAALQVLDNVQQDIPLAAVLRSGIFGEQLTPDELAEIRLLAPRGAFHETLWRYAKGSSLDAVETTTSTPSPLSGRESRSASTVDINRDLQHRLADLLARIARYRERARRRPLSETLWAIYEDEGFLAHCTGLPNGAQRRANLIKLHDLARKFDSFRLQGLHRFLRFLQSLEDEKREVDVAPAVGEADNVVRIMSIHQSKGLEFPVVFVAGLGNGFNIGDRQGRMIFERAARIGLKVLDTEKMIEYPSASHRLAGLEIERTSLEEEMRILYVAMTRARDKLVLVGSSKKADALLGLGTPGFAMGGSSRYSIANADEPLDWLLPLLHDHADKVIVGCGGEGALSEAKDAPLFVITLHPQSEIEKWRVKEPASPGEQHMRRAVAQLGPLPPGEPLTPHDAEVRQTLERLDFTYPHLATTSVKATLTASGYKGMADEEAAAFPQRFGLHFKPHEFVAPPSKYAPASLDEPTSKGTVAHRVLQYLDFAKARDASSVASELQDMVLRGVLTEDECRVVDQEALTWFLQTLLAEKIRSAKDAYRRELRFVTSEPVRVIDPSTMADDGDRVLVRGMVDGIIVGAGELEVIDFKTDAVTDEELEARSAHYNAQIEVYARAAKRLWRRPVRACHLVFLTPRRIVSRQFAPDKPEQGAAPAGQQVFSWMSP